MTAVARIGDIAEQIRGVTYSKSEAVAEPRPGFVPILRAGNIQDSGLSFNDLVYVPADRVSAKQLVRRDDVLVATSSGSLEVVGKATRSQADFDGGFGAFLKVLRPTCDVDPKYFGHYFRTPEYRRTVSLLAAGANINNLKNEHLSDLVIRLPSRDEQRRIAAILDRADALRAKRRQTLTHFDELASAIFYDMFGDPVRNAKAWPMYRLEDQIASMQYGPRFYNESYSSHGVRIVRISDLDRHGRLDFDSMPRMDVSDVDLHKFCLTSGDIVFARTGATVGKLAVIRAQDPPCVAGAYFIRIRLREGVEPEYVAAVLRCRIIQSIIVSGSHQSAQQNFSGPGLRSLPLPLPPTALQRQFSVTLASLAERRVPSMRAESSAEQLFASLQSRAFSGQL